MELEIWCQNYQIIFPHCSPNLTHMESLISMTWAAWYKRSVTSGILSSQGPTNSGAAGVTTGVTGINYSDKGTSNVLRKLGGWNALILGN